MVQPSGGHSPGELGSCVDLLFRVLRAPPSPPHRGLKNPLSQVSAPTESVRKAAWTSGAAPGVKPEQKPQNCGERQTRPLDPADPEVHAEHEAQSAFVSVGGIWKRPDEPRAPETSQKGQHAPSPRRHWRL